MPQNRQREKPEEEKEPTPGGPTPEQRAKEKAREDAQKSKERSLKDKAQSYINIIVGLGLDPRDYRKVIEQAAKQGWGADTFRKRAGLEAAEVGVGEESQFLQGILADYAAVYGKPADQGLIASLQKMSLEQLGAYNSELQKRMEQKGKQDQAKSEYQNQLAATYFDVWGLNPPPGYVEKAAADGINVYEFEAQEKYKPAWMKSQRYKNGTADLASEFGDLMAGG